MKLTYAVVFEQTPNNYAAYAPDLPGCGATHKTWEGIQAMIKEAIEFHIEGLQLSGDPTPLPRLSAADALEYHRAQPTDCAGHFPASGNLDDADPVAILEIEVEVNLATAAALLE